MPSDAATELSKAHGFRPEALDANRAGILAPEQAGTATRTGTGALLLGFGLGLFCLVLGLAGLVAPRVMASLPFGATGANAVVAIVFGVFLLFLAIRFLRRLPGDLTQRRVATAEGFIAKFQRSFDTAQGMTTHTYHYRIKSLTFQVPRAAFERLDTRLRYRVYYLPRSKLVVNMEPIGDPLGAGAAPPEAGAGGGTPARSPATLAPTSGERALPTAEEVSAILGEPFHPAKAPDLGQNPLQRRGAAAAYQNAARTSTLTIQVVLGAEDAAIFRIYMERLTGRGQPVAGLGDEAHYVAGMLIVRRGEVHVFVTLTGERQRARLGSPEVLDQERQVAELVLGRLG